MTDGWTWDLLVLGGGTAGIVGAKTAARLGARVVLVEQGRPGGDCLWTGCVPSKSLIAAAGAAAGARRAGRLGVEAGPVRVDFARVMAHVRDAIATIAPVDSPQALRDAGVVVVTGTARFTSARTVEVDGRPLRFARALLATGAAPTVPDVPGLRAADPWTSETVWDLSERPDRLLVVGGGPIGSELAQAFARLGSQVTLAEGGDRLLPRDDPDAAAVVRTAMADDGVRVLTGHRLVEVRGTPRGPGTAVLESGSGRDTVGYDVLLVALGRTPRTADLGLAAAGIRVTDRGLEVDDHLRTTNRHVWAAGDVTGHPQFTHLAGVHGSLAASNAVLGLRRSVAGEVVPRVTFTDPEVAAVGAPTWAADGPAPVTVTRSHGEVDRAVTEGATAGFSRLVLGRGHRVLGATVVGPRAGEVLAELTLAVRSGSSTSDLSGTTHAYPTFADGAWNAAIADVQGRLEQPVVRAVLRGVVAARRLLGR